MKRSVESLSIASLVFLLLALGCSGGKTDDYSTVSNGVITFQKHLKYGSVGTHGSQGFYVADQHILYKNNEWTPPGGSAYVKDISTCETSPNSDVKVLKCHVIKTGGGGTILIRERDGQPEIQEISNVYDDKNEGEWVDQDGRWILFRDHLINAETNEKREIKQLPDSISGSYSPFLAMSPDLKTAVFAGDVVSPADARERLVDLKLIDVATGTIDERPINATRNPWVFDSNMPLTNVFSRRIWIASHFIWEKDKQGNYQLVFPEILKPVSK